MNRLSLQALQIQLPWTIHYGANFRADPSRHKDFKHALMHISKAHGKLSGMCEDADHHKELLDDPELEAKFGGYVADYIICALRLANTFPSGPIDLARIVEERMESKNNITLNRGERNYSADEIVLLNALAASESKPDPRL